VLRKAADGVAQPSTTYGLYPHSFNEPSFHQQGYAPQTPQPREIPSWQAHNIPPEQTYGYSPAPSYQAMSPYQANVFYASPVNNLNLSSKNDHALILEIILSLFGIFGVGWMMAGETAVGIVLLLCSVCVYWPVILLGTIFTFGLGLICLGPLAIGAIILNILLLNNTLNHKATRFVVMPQPYIPQPPQ